MKPQAAAALDELGRAIAEASPDELPGHIGRLVELEERARLRLRVESAPAAAADDSDLTPEQVAKDQQISVKKVYEMAVQRKLPAVKVGKYWRFPRAEYLRWKERRR